MHIGRFLLKVAARRAGPHSLHETELLSRSPRSDTVSVSLTRDTAERPVKPRSVSQKSISARSCNLTELFQGCELFSFFWIAFID